MPALLTRRTLCRILPCLLAFSLLGMCAVSMENQSIWTQAAHNLARRALARAGSPTFISLQVQNLSPLTAQESAAIKSLLAHEFAAAGAQVVKAERAQAEINITLAENAQGGLWVAQVEDNKLEDVVMESVPRSLSENAPGNGSEFTLHKKILWTQSAERPLLDAALLNPEKTDSALLTLDDSALSLYRNEHGEWALEQSAGLPRSKPWPQDLHGRISLKHDHSFEVFLPGMLCRGLAATGIKMECQESADPWPLGSADSNSDSNDALRGFFSGRNFFTGALTGGILNGQSTAPFFSAAAAGNAEWVFVGVDGRVREVSRDHTIILAGAQAWGSDVAEIRPGCGSANLVLATHNGDFTQSDTVQAFSISNGTASAVSSTVEFAGAITAFWTSDDGSSVTAVSKNLTSDRYEAYLLNLTCH
jgi:hypothetical protein